MSSKNKLYYALDVLIVVAFVLSLATALVWWLNDRQTAVLGLGHGTWRELHTWFSWVMIATIVIHLALHWKWIVAMTKRLRAGRASKARLNYFVDLVLGVSFVLAALTGLAFLLLGQGGYQGGRNPSFQVDLLGISRWTWSDLHIWFSLALVAAVAIHQVFHWKWITNTTRRLFEPGDSPTRDSDVRPAESAVRVRDL